MKAFWTAVPTGFVLALLCAAPVHAAEESAPEKATSAAAAQEICYRLTTPEELTVILGEPTGEKQGSEGDFAILELTYGSVKAIFGRPKSGAAPFVLYELGVGDEHVDIGRDRLLVLRNNADLDKLDPFWGLENVSLANVDLSTSGDLIARMSFDTLTVWPETGKLPEGFDPARLLEEGKTPGLGIRALHERGTDGRGVVIAIIDQPLVRNHEEYADRFLSIEEIDVAGVPAQMHGPSVASIAVGRTCGVAPGAKLAYFAIPMWKWRSCRPYTELVDKIVLRNAGLPGNERVRVISISQGMFPQWEGRQQWNQALRRAAAAGVLVITCDTSRFAYGMLKRNEGADPDLAASYTRGRYSSGEDALLVPGGNRTLAGFRGQSHYRYDRVGGMSWGAPYVAGLAALAFQVDGTLKPADVTRVLVETATSTPEGPVVNPTAFIAAVEAQKAK